MCVVQQVLSVRQPVHAVHEHMPITNKHCSSPVSASTPSWPLVPGPLLTTMDEVGQPTPCVIPCHSTGWPQLDMNPSVQQQDVSAPGGQAEAATAHPQLATAQAYQVSGL